MMIILISLLSICSPPFTTLLAVRMPINEKSRLSQVSIVIMSTSGKRRRLICAATRDGLSRNI